MIYGASVTPLPMTTVVRMAEFTTEDGIYRTGPIPSTDAVAQLLAARPGFFQNDPLETRIAQAAGDNAATETILSGYGMARVQAGRWSALGGVRVEETTVKGEGRQLIFDPAGVLQTIVPAGASTSYANVFPSLHVRCDVRPDLIVRASATRALSRPGYTDLLPTRQFNFVDRRTQSGNPALRPYLGTNYDLSADFYREKLGLFSAAVFYKDITRFIVETQFATTLGSLGNFLERRRVNGGAAHVGGAEFSWKGNALPLGGEVRATPALAYTRLQSSAQLPDRPGESVPLPSQADHQLSASTQFERGKSALEFVARYRTDTLESVVSPGRDLHRRGGWDLEFTLAQKIGKNVKLQFAASNLTNRRTQDYTGTPQRLKEVEVSGREFSLGVQWKR